MQMVTLALLFLGFSILNTAWAADPWPDEVVSVEYGVGAGYGQQAFPGNILGAPDPLATPSVPSATPEELLTLGTGGEIVLAFHDGGIVDGPGADIIIFENPFLIGNTGAVYRETGIVAVSEDGAVWHEFPYDPETFAGLAGVTPVDGSADPLDPEAAGGDAFDLADVGLEHALYLRIRDAADLVLDAGPSFDLDAVAVIHGEQGNGAPEELANAPEAFTMVQAWPNPFNGQVRIAWQAEENRPVRVTIFDMLGRVLEQAKVNGVASWSWRPGAGVSAGTYWVRVAVKNDQQMVRVVLVR